MSAYLHGTRTLILGFVAALAIVAPRATAGDASSVGPDGGRVSPDPIGIPATAPTIQKRSGELDPSFAGDGTTWSYLPGSIGRPYVLDIAEAVAVDAGGGIIVAVHGYGRGFAVLRHKADGTLDTTFGSNGVATPLPGEGGEVHAMGIQPDGRIVVAGFAAGRFALARLMPDGSPDASFGSAGQVLTDLPPIRESAFAMALQADGRIVVAGSVAGWTPAPDSDSNSGALDPEGDFAAVARYNSDGSLDATFGAGGVAFSRSPYGARAVAVQPDGRIVVAGLYFHVTRFNAGGTLDPGFGSGGHVQVPFGDQGSEANAILVQPDGRIVVAGGVYGHDDFALARLDPDGSLDGGFGRGGMVTTDFNVGIDSIKALVLQPDGRLVAAGFGSTLHRGREASHFALARYEPDGALDRSFDKGGRATAAIDDPIYDDGARALAVQPDGRLVAAGDVYFSCEVFPCVSSRGYALARFLP